MFGKLNEIKQTVFQIVFKMITLGNADNYLKLVVFYLEKNLKVKYTLHRPLMMKN